MNKNKIITTPNKLIDRMDGKAKVTGKAIYAAEYQLPQIMCGFLVSSTIAKGYLKSIDIKSAQKAPDVIAVITYQNVNAVFNATGKRIRALPITPDKLI